MQETKIYESVDFEDALISETLDNYFESVTSSNTEHWERYIK